MRLSVKKAMADSVSRWLQKYFDTTNIHAAIPGGRIREIRFFGLRTLSRVKKELVNVHCKKCGVIFDTAECQPHFY